MINLRTLRVFAAVAAVFCCAALFAGCANKYTLARTPDKVSSVEYEIFYEGESSSEKMADGKWQEQAYSKTTRRTECVRLIVPPGEDADKSIRLDYSKNDFHYDEMRRDGQPVEKELQQKYEAIYSRDHVFTFGIDPGGDYAHIYEDRLPAGVIAYCYEKLRSLPLYPVAVGETWANDGKGDDYSYSTQATLAEIEQVDGRRLAVVRGSAEAVWELMDKGQIICKYTDFVQKIDLKTCEVVYLARENEITRLSPASRGKARSFREETMKASDILDGDDTTNIERFARDAYTLSQDADNPWLTEPRMRRIFDLAQDKPDTLAGEMANCMLNYTGKWIGKKLRDIASIDTLTDPINTKKLTDKDLEGKVVVLCFWSSEYCETECDTCMTSTEILSEMQEKSRGKDLVLLAIASNTNETGEGLRATAKKYGIQFPVMRDDKSEIADKFEVTLLPRFIVVGRDGTIIWDGIVPSRDAENFKRKLQSILEEKPE